jgi:hypothetical protein
VRRARARVDLDLDLTRVPVLTDQYAPVDALLDLSVREIDFDRTRPTAGRRGR